MRAFHQGIAAWPADRIAGWAAARHRALTTGPANLLSRQQDARVVPYGPFCSDRYPYRKELGSLQAPPWDRILATPAHDLICTNPFQRSRFRPGMALWDAAIGIPATTARPPTVLPMPRTPRLRGCNAYWLGDGLKALNSIGMGQQAGRLRGPWIFDLKQHPYGWEIMEAAHVLAHLRGDSKGMTRNKAQLASPTAGWYQGSLCSIVFSLMFDLPLCVHKMNEDQKAEPDFKHFGIEVKSSSWIDMSFLRCSWNNTEALRLDQTLAVVNMSVLIEPHPYGYTTGTLQSRLDDRWCCQPTLVMLVGWETVDVIAHQPLVSSDPQDPRRPVCYGIHPADLQDPEDLWCYLAQGHAARGDGPVEPGRYMYFWDWLKSQQYQDLWLETPPLPCRQCSMLNTRTEGVPERPKSAQPKTSRELKQSKPWRQYLQGLHNIRKIIQDATILWETIGLGGRDVALRIRRIRERNRALKVQALREARLVDDFKKRLRDGKGLTQKQETLYSSLKLNAKGKPK